METVYFTKSQAVGMLNLCTEYTVGEPCLGLECFQVLRGSMLSGSLVALLC